MVTDLRHFVKLHAAKELANRIDPHLRETVLRTLHYSTILDQPPVTDSGHLQPLITKVPMIHFAPVVLRMHAQHSKHPGPENCN